MHAFTIASVLRENHEEVIRRWLGDLHGEIAEDYEEMLLTPMGRGLANKLLGLAVDYLGAEQYQLSEVVHQARDAARYSSYRRAAVGFSLTDIVATAVSFRRALNDTLTNHITPASAQEYKQLLDAVMALNRFCDAIVVGEIAGYFARRDFSGDDSEEAARVA